MWLWPTLPGSFLNPDLHSLSPLLLLQAVQAWEEVLAFRLPFLVGIPYTPLRLALAQKPLPPNILQDPDPEVRALAWGHPGAQEEPVRGLIRLLQAMERDSPEAPSCLWRSPLPLEAEQAFRVLEHRLAGGREALQRAFHQGRAQWTHQVRHSPRRWMQHYERWHPATTPAFHPERNLGIRLEKRPGGLYAELLKESLRGQIVEEARLLYVALTRARDLLVLSPGCGAGYFWKTTAEEEFPRLPSFGELLGGCWERVWDLPQVEKREASPNDYPEKPVAFPNPTP